MRQVSSTIWNLWDNGGPYFGDAGSPHSRVTVEPAWFLNTSMSAGNYAKLPVRWWQRKDNSQTEIEVPNIRDIQIDRQLQSDAATCTITLDNQWHYQNGMLSHAGELGQPGYFTFNRGTSPEAQARWGQTTNTWNNILLPNALIRTYQGYGGKSLDVASAITAGNIVLTGVWLVDTVQIITGGQIQLQCRDMSKLLIDQFIFPPLTPHGWYPLSYCRWALSGGTNQQVLYGTNVQQTYQPAASIRYAASSGDPSGQNLVVLGHHPSDALDLNDASYWLSPDGGSAGAWEFYEMTLNSETIDFFFTLAQHVPIPGGWTVYVSVMENGVWQTDGGVIPGPALLNIGYVTQQGADQFNNASGPLPRTYFAQRVRLTYTNLPAATNFGGHRVGATTISVGQTVSNLPPKIIEDIAPGPNNSGYWLQGNDGGVFTLGQLGFYGSVGSSQGQWTGMQATPSGKGYYLCRADGAVQALGDAVYHLDPRFLRTPLAAPIIDMALTPDAGGYWLLGADGGIFSYGNAVFHGNGTAYTGSHAAFASGIAARPQGDGYWIVFTDGNVQGFGAAGSFGAALNANCTGITSFPGGNGYWVVGSDGGVFAIGTGSTFLGSAFGKIAAGQEATGIHRSTTAAGQGYYVVAGDGQVYAFGDATFYGSLPAAYTYTLKKNGNYTDYTDIIVDLLLWSGWWLEDPALSGSAAPEVFGNLETTGVFDASLTSSGVTGVGEGCLPEDVFDKKPVIDAITQLKEIVGFNFWVDEEGGARFELPNWYTPGNRIMDDGSHTTFVPVIDEATNLIDYALDYTDSPVRSEIIIASADPDYNLSGTVTSILNVKNMAPESTALLRGMCKPAMWVNETFQQQAQLDVMAKRVATQILFNQRTAKVTCAFNPAIQINDQVQIYERQTSETYVHYVRGVHISHNLESGKMEMVLDTHWLGTGNNFIITTWGTPGHQAVSGITTAGG